MRISAGTLRAVAVSSVLLVMFPGCSAPNAVPPAAVGSPAHQSNNVPWKPKTPLPRTTLSESEMESRRLQALDQERESYGLGPMQYPSRIRWVYREEIAATLVPCLAGKGFTVEASSGGTGVKGQVASAQNQPFARALLECKAQYSLDPRLDLEPTEAQKALVYEYWSEYVIPCVRKHGKQIGSLPSRQVWLADPKPMDDYPMDDPVISAECPYNVPSRLWLGE